MTTLLAQIAPQRSAQYSALASTLAPHELKLSPLEKKLVSIEPVKLGNQQYLKCTLDEKLEERQINELALLAMSSAYFLHYDRLGEFDGPFLRPIDACFSPKLPAELITTRRYLGKTNELFTHFMCNLARFSSDFSTQPWTDLRVFDPLAGGGTTLFVALVLGAEAAGLEQNKKSIHSTAVFLKQFLQERRIHFSLKEERLKKLKASRWDFALGEESFARCILAKGEIAQTGQLISSFKRPHFIVADLPYGIQHKGGLHNLLYEALPVWDNLLLPGGTLVFSWESTRFPRSEMIDLVESASDLSVFNEPPYDRLAHRVDRVIKSRDIVVARADAPAH